MNILISTLSQTPIYEQIRGQFKEMVLTGKLKSGEQLPSIRLLSKDLKVGVVTVKRAYEELEKEGIVINLQGRGCFVAEIDAAKIKKIHLNILSERLHEIKDFSSTAGISREEVISVLNKVYRGGNDDR
ncbi:GntR family transcriptional regulator [Candidatus Contubernalis alkaliaceticus]|uniref:GntR family transcriptional regulator n=1 Tax=Candidatus Contubernalis alkaliaceticus TaxID=338645 RepID=UPI001F4C0875|nr:GntR family transcriptional regulator [Candidatus Contubernalis alkalaceticus]UNC92168.1 GntR family transcriptional regulator [Candidatus Contubernalis alkalaceticus]